MTLDPISSKWMKKPITLEERMCGFTYFSDIYDAKNWNPDNVDPLQRANTPLVQRATLEDPNREQKLQKLDKPLSPMPKSTLMLATDYNAYSPHEACQGAIRQEEEYFVQFWQYVDVFVYFVHRHIAIPPPTWVNAGHRNGAQILGLLMFEGDGNIDQQTAAMFEKVGDRYWLADKLAKMASCYGFDGWFFNVEAEIYGLDEKEWQNGKAMDEFIEQLKEGLVKYGVPNGGKVIWYDSLVRENTLEYQHTLNENNLVFSQKAGSIFTDYPAKWQTDLVQVAKDAGNYAVANGLTRENVYLGRNIFATIANGPSLEPMAKYGLGSGLFATGWCFQKFKPPPRNPTADMKTYRSDADRYMWTGEPDLEDLAELKKNDVFGEASNESTNTANVIDRYINKGNQTQQCITQFAKIFPAGSDAFFYTNYGTAVDYHGPQKYTAHLSEQSIWPSHSSAPLKTSTATAGRIITKHFGAHAPCAIAVELGAGSIPDGTQAAGSIILHNVNMRGDLNLNLTLKYKRSADLQGLKIFAFAVAKSQSPKVELTGGSGTLATQSLALGGGHDPITAIGIHLQGPMSLFAAATKVDILDVFEMLVKPQENYGSCKFTDVGVIQDGATGKLYSRLNWAVSPILKADHRPTHLPYSSVTGPFSHFNVSIGGTAVGRAYTVSFIFDQHAVSKLNVRTGANVEIAITGVAFDGTVFEPYKQTVTWH